MSDNVKKSLRARLLVSKTAVLHFLESSRARRRESAIFSRGKVKRENREVRDFEVSSILPRANSSFFLLEEYRRIDRKRKQWVGKGRETRVIPSRPFNIVPVRRDQNGGKRTTRTTRRRGAAKEEEKKRERRFVGLSEKGILCFRSSPFGEEHFDTR